MNVPVEEAATAHRNTAATLAIAQFRTGRVDAAAMLAAVRTSVLIVPVTGRDEVLLGHAGGVAWLPAFTSEEELGRFARERREGEQVWQYVTVRGARLLGPVVATLLVPCGVAVDVASAQPMLLPPTVGIVPGTRGPDPSVRPGAPRSMTSRTALGRPGIGAAVDE